MNNKMKSTIINLLKLIGLYKPMRGIYNFVTLFNAKKKIKILDKEAIFITPTYRIIEDLDTIFGEKEFLEAFLTEIRPNDVVWDVGASYGIYSIFSAMMATKGKIYAFEPEASTHKMLIKNIKFNNLRNISTIQAALSDKKGEALLYRAESANIGTHSLTKRTDYPVSKKGVIIKTLTGDGLLSDNGIESPNLIKIDVEGAEMNVLYGMRKILKSKELRVLQIEIHPKILSLSDYDENMIAKFIEQYSFNIIKRKLRGNEIEVIYKKSQSPQD